MKPFLDEARRQAHKAKNDLHSALLVAGLGLLTGFSAWLLWGGIGVAVTLIAIGVLYAFAPRLPPEVVMRLYRGREIDPHHGSQITHIVDVLADRAELPTPPRVYVDPQHDAQRVRHRHAREGRDRGHRGPAAALEPARARRRPGPRDQPYPQQRPRRHEPGRRP